MFETAADEMREWAERCRRWAVGARTGDHSATLRGLETLLSQAADEAEQNADGAARPPVKS